MAVIGMIRSKFGTLMIIVIGLAMIAFLLGDILSQGGSFFSQDTSVGEIAGREIDARVFEQRVEIEMAKYQQQQGRTADETTGNMIRERVWNDMLRDFVLGDQLAELGIDVSTKELYDMFAGPDPHPLVVQSFTDPNTGQFNQQQVIQTLKQLDQMPPENKVQWDEFQRALIQQRITDKYNGLIKSGLYVTHFETKEAYLDANRKYNIKYVAKNYNQLSDSMVTYDDGDLKSYYNEHKEQYEQEESRTIKVVMFPVDPSVEDWKAAEEEINGIYEEFAATKEDTNFLASNFGATADIRYYNEDKLPVAGDSVLLEDSLGTTLKPALVGFEYRIVKLLNKKTTPDSVKARHILIEPNRAMTVEGAKNFADSLKKLVQEGGADFAELAKANSKDAGSAVKGGDLGYFTFDKMVPPFANACFDGKVGDMPIVESQFGVHLIEITEQQGSVNQMLLASLTYNVEPSNATYEAVYGKATDFSLNSGDFTTYMKLSEEGGMPIQEATLKPGDRNVLDLESSRGLVRWAYSNEEGKISEAQQYGKKFVVAALTSAKEDGIPELEKIKDEIIVEVIKDKKGELMAEKLGGGSTLDEAAHKWESQVQEAPDVVFSNFAIPGIGTEPKVLGTIATMQKGQTSIAIQGDNGIFMVKIEEAIIPPTDGVDMSEFKQQLKQSRESGVDYSVFEALKEKAGVKDERHKFY